MPVRGRDDYHGKLIPFESHQPPHAAPLAIRAGAHPKAIQEMLGHSSVTLTLDRYGHLLPSLAEQLADRPDADPELVAGMLYGALHYQLLIRQAALQDVSATELVDLALRRAGAHEQASARPAK